MRPANLSSVDSRLMEDLGHSQVDGVESGNVMLFPQPDKPWLDPRNAPRVWYPGVCRLCGRPMHSSDYVCPTPTAHAVHDEGAA